MTTRSFTIYHGVVSPGVLTDLWPGSSSSTVLLKALSVTGWTGGSGKTEVWVEGPAGAWPVWSATVSEYQSIYFALWHALSPGMGILALAAGPGQARITLSGTLLPAGPGLERAGQLPGPRPDPRP